MGANESLTTDGQDKHGFFKPVGWCLWSGNDAKRVELGIEDENEDEEERISRFRGEGAVFLGIRPNDFGLRVSGKWL